MLPASCRGPEQEYCRLAGPADRDPWQNGQYRRAPGLRRLLGRTDYTVFSNTTSAAEWNENAAQVVHGAADDLPVIDGYPGTNSVDSQGATPGHSAEQLAVHGHAAGPLHPDRERKSRAYMGRDGFNIERQLGYTYGDGSLEDQGAVAARAAAAPAKAPKVHVSGVNRGHIAGSFVITAFAQVGGERKPIGSEAVLSRWHVDGCANCQTHLLAGAALPQGQDRRRASPVRARPEPAHRWRRLRWPGPVTEAHRAARRTREGPQRPAEHPVLPRSACGQRDSQRDHLADACPPAI